MLLAYYCIAAMRIILWYEMSWLQEINMLMFDFKLSRTESRHNSNHCKAPVGIKNMIYYQQIFNTALNSQQSGRLGPRKLANQYMMLCHLKRKYAIYKANLKSNLSFIQLIILTDKHVLAAQVKYVLESYDHHKSSCHQNKFINIPTCVFYHGQEYSSFPLITNGQVFGS